MSNLVPMVHHLPRLGRLGGGRGPGRRRHRQALRAAHSTVVLHQPHGGAKGQSADIEIQAREILRLRAVVNQILAAQTGQPLERIERDTDRDFILNAEQALEYGLVDEVLSDRQAVPALSATAGSRG